MLVLTLVVICLNGGLIASKTTECDVHIDTTCYRFWIEPADTVSYDRAVSWCKSNGFEIGQIATMDAQNQIMNKLRSKIPHGKRGVKVWTGITINAAGAVTPSDTYNRGWFPTFPMMVHGPRFTTTNVFLLAVAESNSRHQGKINTYPGHKLNGAVCQKLSCKPDEILHLNVCYWIKFGDSKINIPDAQSICAEQGSTLADVMDSTHYQLLVEKIRSMPLWGAPRVWLGMRYDPRTRISTSSTGARTPYMNWAFGQPIHSSGATNVFLRVHSSTPQKSDGMYNSSPQLRMLVDGAVCQYKLAV